MSEKFKPNQKVVVPNFVMNGNVMNVTGTVQKYIWTGQYKGKVIVTINTVDIPLDESRLVDHDEFWAKKQNS